MADAYQQLFDPTRRLPPEATPSYEYSMLCEIMAETCFPVHRNLFAVVIDCSTARPTDGRDLMANMIVADPSQPGTVPAEGVKILFFAPNERLLPTPDCVGDIIRIHRLLVQEWHSAPQLVARLGPGRQSACCLFASEQGPRGEPIEATFHSTPNYSMSAQDQEAVRKLRECIAVGAVPTDDMASADFRRIRDLDPQHMTAPARDGGEMRNTFFNIRCKVLHVEGSGADRTMFLWDGSDARPMEHGVDTRQDFAAQAHVNSEEGIGALKRLPLPLHAEGVPRLGIALPVVLHALSARLRAATPLPEAGEWVKLRNLGACVIEGQLQALYTKSAQWAPWKHPTPEALHALEAREQAGTIAEWAPSDPAELLASTLHPDVPFETLRQVHQASVSKEGTLHRCLVRVISIVPESVEEFCARRSDIGVAGTSESGEYVYTLTLTLQDATEELDAAVFDEDGTVFFQGQRARELQAGVGLARKIASAMQSLLSPAPDGPGWMWMECCLKGYTVKKDQPGEARMYRIFGTQLRPDLLAV